MSINSPLITEYVKSFPDDVKMVLGLVKISCLWFLQTERRASLCWIAGDEWIFERFAVSEWGGS